MTVSTHTGRMPTFLDHLLSLYLDAVVSHYGIDIPAQLAEGTVLIPTWVAGGSAILPTTLVLAGGLRRRRAIAAPAQA